MDLIAFSSDNSNYSDYDNYTEGPLVSSDQLFEGYNPGLLNFASIACIVFILLGVPGNLITIIALARCKKVRNATAVFIINLSLSDFLFCCFNLPLAASTFWHRSWTYGELLCRLFPMLRYGLLAVSLFTILAITLNRYVMIGHPRIYPRLYRRKYLACMVALTWLCGFCCLIPTWRGVWGTFGLDKNIGSCSILPDHNHKSPKEFLFIMAFALPCLAIVVCYARIFYIVRKTALRSHEPMVVTKGSVKISKATKKQQKKALEALNKKLEEDAINIPNHEAIDDPVIVLSKYSLEAKDDYDNIGNEQMQIEHSDENRNRSSSNRNSRKHLSKFRDEDFKFIDTSLDNDSMPKIVLLPPDNELRPITTADRQLSSISIGKSVEFSNENEYEGTKITINGSKVTMDKLDVDSAVEESTSSYDINQIYNNGPSHVETQNQLLSIHIDPSSSSGIDIPVDIELPPKPERKKKFISALRQSAKLHQKRFHKKVTSKVATARRQSTVNTSGASILYPGRMTAKDRRLLKMILVIFISFLICYLPITLTKIVRTVTDLHAINIMGYLLIYLTTCINPIIYVVMSSEYRQAYWNLLMCRSGSRSSNDVGGRGSQRT